MESRAEILGKNTLHTKLGLWVANLRDNLSIINSCKDITELPNFGIRKQKITQN